MFVASAPKFAVYTPCFAHHPIELASHSNGTKRAGGTQYVECSGARMSVRVAWPAGPISIIALLFCLGTPAEAHHPGVGGNGGSGGPINIVSASTLAQGQIGLAVRYEFIRLGQLSDADLIAAANQGIHAHSMRSIEQLSFGAAYGITDDLTVSFRLPFVRRSDIREAHMMDMDAGHMMGGMGGMTSGFINARGNSAGVGDVTLLGQYRFHKNAALGIEAAVLFGIKAPTGQTNRVDNMGELFQAEFQPGTGSWDGLLGFALSKRMGPLSFDVSGLYLLAGKGTQDTDQGDRFLFGAGVSYRAIGFIPPGQGKDLHAHCMQPENQHHDHCKDHANHNHKHVERAPFALDLVLELHGEWHDNQRIAGVVDPNSGGVTVYLSPGVRAVVDRYSAFVSVGVPVINEHNGVQSKPDWRVMTGISAAFD
jgi:hypothetical protein